MSDEYRSRHCDYGSARVGPAWFRSRFCAPRVDWLFKNARPGLATNCDCCLESMPLAGLIDTKGAARGSGGPAKGMVCMKSHKKSPRRIYARATLVLHHQLAGKLG